ncbi:DUF916 and DUF3324 domain-containing protein [Enterococcus hirae]|uniref:DUF916 and DUF3324 domain-containing protein n=1 Tax=Enterococcus hirae TaxID=1354 RepID=UPI000BA0D750|nr:DUF916 and DUF3324 domain-containing protein [Enterococcus hirae]OZS41201.1 cell surface protein [Enterococcus hirae]PWG75709.1 DUF916 and DUF3324 domain-containing protein [Enterococcus hirae]
MNKIEKLLNNSIRLLCLLSIIFANLFFGIVVTFADENSTDGFGGFSIEGIPNVHQIDKNSSYFYLKEDPNSTDKITIKLNNSSNKDKILDIKVVDANTNSNGILDYTGSIKNNKILKLPLTSIVKPQAKEVTVPKNSSVETNLSVSMPAEKFSGVVLGGVVVSEKKDNVKQKEGIVGNEYSYTIGIVLTNDNKVELFKNISVELEKVGPILSAGKKIVQADILNPNPYVFSKAEVTGTVYEEGSSTKLKENTMQNVSIAPYSAFPFQLDWQKEDLKPGNYVFKCSVKTAENTWNFEKKFEIKNDEAKEINKESVFKVILPNWFKYSSAGLIGVIIAGTVYVYIQSSNRKSKKN